MKASKSLLLVTGLLSFVEAQDLYSILVSDAASVYSEVTSILVSAASATATTTSDSQSAATLTSPSSESATSSDSYDSASSSSSEYSSSTSSSPTASSTLSSTSSSRLSQTSSTITAATTKSIPSTLATSSVLGSTAETSTPSVSSSKSSHDHNLAIILGTVLGALALGLLILALLLCWKRRRASSPRHRGLFPDDDEVESWRLNRQSDPIGNSSMTASHQRLSAAGAAPLMSEHPAFRNYDGENENPFIPVPPPPRRTAPNSRAGLTDGTFPGEDPFLNEKEVAVGRPTSWRSYASNNRSNEKDLIAAGLAGGAAAAGLNHHNNSHMQKDDELNEKAIEPQAPRQIHRKPIPVNQTNGREPWPYSPVSPVDPATKAANLAKSTPRDSDDSGRRPSRDAARANASFNQIYAPSGAERAHGHMGVAAELSAAAAGAIGGAALTHHDEHRREKSRSSERGAHSQSPRRPAVMHRNSSDLSTSSSSSNYSHGYSAALPKPATQLQPESSVAPAPYTSNPQFNPYSAPAIPPKHSRRNSPVGTSAAYTYPNRPANPSPLGNEIRREPSKQPLQSAGVMALPSRRPRDNSASRYSFDHTPYDSYPGGRGEYFPDDSTLVSATGGLVGDDRYPHMGVPRRQSGGEFHNVPSQAQSSTPPPLPRDSKVEMWMPTAGDESSWRMSSGMPSGWQRQSPRNSGSHMQGAPGGKRLRASDLPGREDSPYARAGLGQAL
ncbi:hypothetical protein EDD37DRAFT_604690 [Exophiala viscosa]|uniref:Uncharacterized protein n=1 Tax=Exophiala viscosa TaxID=2486360 RepID=A0AAN6IGX3_9EURO|nr:hypothetical protein EDD36DRAFT_429607 [Exophiala viscosa]KAI1629815.1 hypothetical protein EDD37DRAFT_604690 [Exophiala viscosa]